VRKQRLIPLLERGELQHLEAVAAWLGRPAQWYVVDEIRSRHGRNRINRTRRLSRHHADERRSPLEEAQRAEDVQRVRWALTQIRPRYAETLLLRMQGLSNKQCAERMRCGIDNIERMVRLGRAALVVELLRGQRTDCPSRA